MDGSYDGHMMGDTSTPPFLWQFDGLQTETSSIGAEELNLCANFNTSPAALNPELNDPQYLHNLPSTDFQDYTRGLPRRRSRYFNDLSLRDTSGITSGFNTPDEMDPMQRWRSSPPAAEPASVSAISAAVQRSPPLEMSNTARRPRSTSTFSRGSSTRHSSRSSASSLSTSTRGSNRSHVPHRVVRKRSSKPRRSRVDENGRIFQCTFCCDTFRMKHDWARHEKALHLNIDQWLCTPFGGIMECSETGQVYCVYCFMFDPSKEHLDSHNHNACSLDGSRNVFSRKDHLIQHLRHFHRIERLPDITSWKLESPSVSSRCGFCDAKLMSWESRVDHLAEHFRQGLTLQDWRGDHGFDTSIAKHVTNAIPPYTLATESASCVPFSATNPHYHDHLSQIAQRHQVPKGECLEFAQRNDEDESTKEWSQELNPTTYTSFLAFHLGRFAQRSWANGIVPTDQMFQDEGRRLVFGDSDGWDMTLADNQEWLITKNG